MNTFHYIKSLHITLQDPVVHLENLVDLVRLDHLDRRVHVDLPDPLDYLEHQECRDNLDR